MSYRGTEGSGALGAPYELYQFRRRGSPGACWAYTSYHKPITHEGVTYRPASISRGEIELSDESSSATLEVKLSRRLGVVPQFMLSLPANPVWLTVYRGHFGDADSEVVTIFRGQVANFKRSGGEATLVCTSMQGALEKRVPRMVYQQACNHALYDNGCGVDPEAFRTDATVSAVTGDGRLRFPGDAGAKAAGYYTAGVLVLGATGERAFIVKHEKVGAEAWLTLLQRPAALVAGSAVTLFAGCDRLVDTCRQRFANVSNFMGFPFMPNRNPFVQLTNSEDSAWEHKPWEYPPDAPA